MFFLHETFPFDKQIGRRVAAEHYDEVSIFFSDIVGFTEMSAAVSPIAVVDFLNNLYNIFDGVLEDFDVYKVNIGRLAKDELL